MRERQKLWVQFVETAYGLGQIVRRTVAKLVPLRILPNQQRKLDGIQCGDQARITQRAHPGRGSKSPDLPEPGKQKPIGISAEEFGS